eukprot:TRINITY_DN21131_c2_g1_i1.p1 TRINITY_DN21131_c2_g1~~TRINITY_DN21131_c2_g1_i1.p1  ORF type:complete len:402 (-),score=109.22 TRINITY_DN21131_c2_g1_i1:100-1305(-)
MVAGLLGSYDSGSDSDVPLAPREASGKAQAPKSNNKDAKASAKAKAAPEEESEDEEEEHGPFCECEDCTTLLARFMAKNLQTKGIRFKCKLSGQLFPTKAAAGQHFKETYGQQVVAFKREKMPRLYKKLTKADYQAMIRKQAFSTSDVLHKKRPIDDDSSFGGWAKKEKPEPAPCTTEAYAEQMDENAVFVPPPWAGGTRPTNEDATEMDKDVDRRIIQAQIGRFTKRNVMEVNKETVRCKLCYKTSSCVRECAAHIRDDHDDDFKAEIKIWERFLFSSCKRQPPFGWVCKICQIFFPSDGAAWRHIGKEVFIRQEERHMENWIEKEDRWGHEADGECCGDGLNSGGISFESVQKFQAEAMRLEKEAAKKEMQGPANKPEESSSSDSEPENVGEVKEIKEF